MNTTANNGILGFLRALKSTKNSSTPAVSWASADVKKNANEWIVKFKLKPDTVPNFSAIYECLHQDLFCGSLMLWGDILILKITPNDQAI
jgi:hypothetical protein